MKFQSIRYPLSIILLFFAINSCSKFPLNKLDETILPSDPAVLWGEMTLKIMTKMPLNTPTYASRALGYMGLTMYESVVYGSNNNQSLVNQLSSLTSLPIPDTTKNYNWILALNAGQAAQLKNLYDYMDAARQYSIDSLESVIQNRYAVLGTQEINDRSIAFGRAIAAAIFDWSKTDGGFQGYLRNFDPNYVFPTGPGYWIAPIGGQSASKIPLHPYWGKNRTFAPSNLSLAIPAMITYSTDPNSAYYQQYFAVYKKSQTLTQTDKEIAAWWGDDPSESFSPPGHSYSIANIAIKTSKPDLMKAAETYARVGMSVGDAFVSCWKAKYNYFCERPSNYVRTVIDNTWYQLWPEPPFPAFYSGHSVQSSASSTVLADLYGDNFTLTDNSNLYRVRDTIRNIDFKARTFTSFSAIATESGQSRILGGIHTQQDNEIGMAQGKIVGANINALKWRKPAIMSREINF